MADSKEKGKKGESKMKNWRNKPIWIGALIGFIFGFINPWIIQIKPIYPVISTYYLELIGTKFSGGNWHLISYIPLFILIWSIIGSIIGYLINKLLAKRSKNV